MSFNKLLGQKRYSNISQEEEEYKSEYSLPKVKLINYNIEDINYLIQKELDNSWNQMYKISKKLPLKNEKYKYKKIFSNNLELYRPIKKIYLLNRSNENLLKQEKDYISHCLEINNHSINQIIEINQSKNIPFKKFNIILDIDFTIIKAVALTDINFQKKDSDIQIKGIINEDTPFEFHCRYRPYLFNFINEIKDYFNFYVSTLGQSNYANKILDDFKKKANIDIPKKNIISNISNKLFKNLDDFECLANNEKELNNTIIIDDIINFWIKPLGAIKNEKDIEYCIKSLIPSKKYVINNKKEEDNKYGILIHNNIFEEKFDKFKNYSIDVDLKYCIEKDSNSENGKYGQLYYLTKFIKKCIEYSLFSGVPLVNAMDYYRRKIFENCKFNLKFLGNDWNFCIPNIIKELGGNIVINPDETTHFIVENKINMKNINYPNNNKIFININYIFQCYFNLNRMNEYEKQFVVNNTFN